MRSHAVVSVGRIKYKWAAVVLAGVLAVAGSALGASQASASTNWWVGSWSIIGNVGCPDVGDAICLFYHPGPTNKGAYLEVYDGIPNLSGYVFSGKGLAGAGQKVRNNAASMESIDPSCSAQVFVYPMYTGDSNEVGPYRGGNLNWALVNNEASVTIEGCGY